MKNMKKFITLCGFLILGSIACGDADVVKAEAISNQTTDTSGYTITIPSDVDIDKDSGKGSFAVSGKAEAQVDLNVSVSSKNNYKLKNKSQEISYSLDKESFHIDNVRSANSKSFNEDFNITLANTNTSFSGSYEDKLVFDITGNKREYYLDVNGLIDGKDSPNIENHGTFDVYINGKLVANDVSDYCLHHPYGTNYEIKDIKYADGWSYKGIWNAHSNKLSGVVGEDCLIVNTGISGNVVYLQFDSNGYTLTINPNGGTINNSSNSVVAPLKMHLNKGTWNNLRYYTPSRIGYDFAGWYTEADGGTQVYNPSGSCVNEGTYWSNNLYKYHGDLTVYAQWKKAPYSTGTVLNIEGNDYIVMGQTEDGNYRLISGTSIGNMQYQPNQDSNGNYYDVGKYNENDLPETRYDEQNSNVYEDSYIDKYLESTYYNSLPEKLKKAIVATQIKQASYTNTDMNSKWRLLSKDTNPVSPDGTSNWFYNEGTLENPKYVRYDKVTTPDGDGGVYPLKYWTKKEKGYGEQAYNEITRHVYLPSIEEINNLVDLNNANKTYAFLKGTNNSLNHMWLRDASSISSRDAMILYYDHLSLGNNFVTDPWFGVRPAFVVDLSKIDYTVTGSVNYK